MDFLFSSKKREEKKAADDLLARGDAEGALKVYRRLEHKGGMTAAAEHLLVKGRLRPAGEAFAAAGNADGLRRTAEAWLERGQYGEWIKALQLAHTEIPAAEHARVARFFLDRSDLQTAEKAFAAAGDSDGLHELARRYLNRADLDNAARLLRKCGTPADLAPLAERYLQRGDLDKAGKLFAEAGNEAGRRRVEARRAEGTAGTDESAMVPGDDFDPEDPHHPDR
jgi:tetratricopeptide (TPR) repeat protein